MMATTSDISGNIIKQTVKRALEEVLKEKMVSPNTVMLNLQKYKDTFERVDKWVYQMKK